MKQIIPLGDRILVKRRKIGEKIGSESLIIAPHEVSERLTDLADVKYVPELTFADKEILDNSENIIIKLTNKSKDGDVEALKALLQLNAFIKIKSIQPGDSVMISKYVGVDFHSNENNEQLTIVNSEDIIGVLIESENT